VAVVAKHVTLIICVSTTNSAPWKTYAEVISSTQSTLTTSTMQSMLMLGFIPDLLNLLSLSEVSMISYALIIVLLNPLSNSNATLSPRMQRWGSFWKQTSANKCCLGGGAGQGEYKYGTTGLMDLVIIGREIKG
jgi:hypothetical protein